ncbi:hypothetical protein C8R45DRAFT_922229 [Mycena sanguinolenta]|nr:hypothetical protein C8R45DRAFT_922229 [Mycena sanguinolenta]
MYRHGRRLLQNGLAEVQRVPSSGQTRFKATTPPTPQKADLQSIIPALRELLPVLPKRDDSNPSPNATKRKRRGPLFYLALISPLFIWIEVEKYFDPQPLLEKKRKRILRERLERLRDGNRSAKPTRASDVKATLAYLRLLLSTMLPDETLRNLSFEQACDLVEEDCQENVLQWLREICVISYDLSQQPGDETAEVKAAEQIQDVAEEVLRKIWLSVHHRIRDSPVDAPSDP